MEPIALSTYGFARLRPNVATYVDKAAHLHKLTTDPAGDNRLLRGMNFFAIVFV